MEKKTSNFSGQIGFVLAAAAMTPITTNINKVPICEP